MEAAVWQLVARPQACGTGRSHRRTPSKNLPRTRYGDIPAFEAALGGAALNPSTTSRIGKALVPHRRPFGEQGSILCGLSRVGDRTLQVSRHEFLEKPDNGTNYCRVTMPLQGFRGLTAPIDYSVVTTLRQEFTGVTSGRQTLLPLVQFSHRSKVGESPDPFHGQLPRPLHTSQPSDVFPLLNAESPPWMSLTSLSWKTSTFWCVVDMPSNST